MVYCNEEMFLFWNMFIMDINILTITLRYGNCTNKPHDDSWQTIGNTFSYNLFLVMDLGEMFWWRLPVLGWELRQYQSYNWWTLSKTEIRRKKT